MDNKYYSELESVVKDFGGKYEEDFGKFVKEL